MSSRHSAWPEHDRPSRIAAVRRAIACRRDGARRRREAVVEVLVTGAAEA